MSTIEPSGTAGASAAPEAVGARLTASPNPPYERRWMALMRAARTRPGVLPGLVLVGTGIGSAAVVAVAVGQMGVEPRDAGTAGALNNVSQQLGSAIGVALISTFVATATSHYLTRHGSTAVVGATVHGFTVGYWWAAGVFRRVPPSAAR